MAQHITLVYIPHTVFKCQLNSTETNGNRMTPTAEYFMKFLLWSFILMNVWPIYSIFTFANYTLSHIQWAVRAKRRTLKTDGMETEKKKKRNIEENTSSIRNFMQWMCIKIDKCDPFCSVHFNSVLTIWSFCYVLSLCLFIFDLFCHLFLYAFPSTPLPLLASIFHRVFLSFLFFSRVMTHTRFGTKSSCSKKSNCIKMWFCDFTTTIASNWRKNAKHQ